MTLRGFVVIFIVFLVNSTTMTATTTTTTTIMSPAAAAAKTKPTTMTTSTMTTNETMDDDSDDCQTEKNDSFAKKSIFVDGIKKQRRRSSVTRNMSLASAAAAALTAESAAAAAALTAASTAATASKRFSDGHKANRERAEREVVPNSNSNSNSAQFYHNLRCSKVTSLEGTTRYRDRKSSSLLISSTIASVIGLDESLCFQLRVNANVSVGLDEGTLAKHRRIGETMIRVSFVSVEQHHEVKERYSFAIPRISQECICDCPGGRDFCWSSMTGMKLACDSDDHFCVNKYFGRQSTSGCFINDDDAELCCKIKIVPKSGETFHAYFLGVPRTVAKFQVDTFSSVDSGKLLESKVILLELHQGSRAELKGSKSEVDFLMETTGGIPSGIGHGMYYSKKIPGSKVMTGIPINRPSEWDVSKVGWFKRHPHLGFQFAHSLVRDAFEARTTGCSESLHDWSFKGNFFHGSTNTLMSNGVSVEELYRNYLEAHYDARHDDVIVRHRQFPLMNLFLTLNQSEESLFFFDESAMESFDAELGTDLLANRYLKLRLRGAAGTILGVIFHAADKNREERRQKERRHDEDGSRPWNGGGGVGSVGVGDGERSKVADDGVSFRFSFYVKEEQEGEYFVSIPRFISNNSVVCIHALSKTKEEKCQTPKINSAKTKNVSFSDMIHPWRSGHGASTSTSRGAPWWTSYLNPMEWIDGIQSWVEGVVMTTEIIAALVIILVVFKIFAYLCRCSSPSSSRAFRPSSSSSSSRYRSSSAPLSRSASVATTLSSSRPNSMLWPPPPPHSRNCFAAAVPWGCAGCGVGGGGGGGGGRRRATGERVEDTLSRKWRSNPRFDKRSTDVASDYWTWEDFSLLHGRDAPINDWAPASAASAAATASVAAAPFLTPRFGYDVYGSSDEVGGAATPLTASTPLTATTPSTAGTPSTMESFCVSEC